MFNRTGLTFNMLRRGLFVKNKYYFRNVIGKIVTALKKSVSRRCYEETESFVQDI